MVATDTRKDTSSVACDNCDAEATVVQDEPRLSKAAWCVDHAPDNLPE